MKKLFPLLTRFILSFYIIIGGVSLIFAQSVSDIRSLLSSDGKILFGVEPNSVMVMDHADNLKKVENYLAMVDTMPRQVLIEARVVEVKLTEENSLGINWSAFADHNGWRIGQFNVGSALNQGLSQDIPFQAVSYPPGGSLAQEPFTINIFDENINVVLKALATNFKTNILSAPSISTVNNRVAEIKVIQKLPWAEPSVAVSEYGAVTVTWTIHFEQVGIVLNVTPTITDDGRIAMDIKPDVSEKTADFTLTVTDPNGKAIPYTVPIIDSRTANTKVIVGNGQTFIIGGLMKETTTDGSTKVPVLGDIPGLGWMFKNNKKTKEKTELLIFVSPTIITPSVMQRMADRSEVYSPAKNVPAAGDEKERAVKSKPPRDLEVLKIDKDRWKKVLSSVNSLESKVEDLTANRENLERQIRINN